MRSFYPNVAKGRDVHHQDLTFGLNCQLWQKHNKQTFLVLPSHVTPTEWTAIRNNATNLRAAFDELETVCAWFGLEQHTLMKLPHLLWNCAGEKWRREMCNHSLKDFNITLTLVWKLVHKHWLELGFFLSSFHSGSYGCLWHCSYVYCIFLLKKKKVCSPPSLRSVCKVWYWVWSLRG